jgi:S-adenosylmethionine:tRNA ribosyltransferase-isomerase
VTRTADFVYELPGSAIAQQVMEPRDAARLLVASTMQDAGVRDLPSLLSPGDLLVVNRTRVRAARLKGKKSESGGAVEVLLLRPREDGDWDALCRPARRLRPGTLLDFGRIQGEIVSGPENGMASVALHSDEGEVEDLLTSVGSVPLPPYFHGKWDDDERYQTMFAKSVGSAAAPTAGLHFTPRLVADLRERGIGIAEIALDIGLDTFRPIGEATLEAHRMHHESYSVTDADAEAVNAVREAGGRVIAVGTTVVRTLESTADSDGRISAGGGSTDLFITPGYRFKAVDGVITNFHAPGTTLTVLIAALLGTRWRDVYATALDRGYRFLSFGDAMYVDRIEAP